MITNGLYKQYPNYRFSALGFTKLTCIWQITNFHKTTVLLSEMRSRTFDAAWSPRFRESAGYSYQVCWGHQWTICLRNGAGMTAGELRDG